MTSKRELRERLIRLENWVALLEKDMRRLHASVDWLKSELRELTVDVHNGEGRDAEADPPEIVLPSSPRQSPGRWYEILGNVGITRIGLPPPCPAQRRCRHGSRAVGNDNLPCLGLEQPA